MKKLKQMYRRMQDRMYGKSKDKAVSIPPYLNTSIPRRSGFTLVELVIVIAIVIILSVISVPIYRGYVDKAKWSEGYALMGAIISAQKAYYSEYGNFLRRANGGYATNYNTVLGIDARGNKYFTYFIAGGDNSSVTYFHADVYKPADLGDSTKDRLRVYYFTDTGATIKESNP